MLPVLVIHHFVYYYVLIRRQVIASYARVCLWSWLLCGIGHSAWLAFYSLSVLHRGTSQGSSAYSETPSEFQFSEAVLQRGRVVCSKCFKGQNKKNATLTEKDLVLKTCPVHRDTAWNPMLVWPSKDDGKNTSYVSIRSRPRNVIVHFTLCRYRNRCHLAERCPYPHNIEELEVWTLDRDGGKCCTWRVDMRVSFNFSVVESWKFRQPKKLCLCERYTLIREGRTKCFVVTKLF